MNTIVKSSLYQNGTNLDKNGLPSLFLSVVGGSFPRSLTVISGTHAELIGVEPNKTYLVNVIELSGVNSYTTHDGKSGKSKNWTMIVVGEVSPMEVVQMEGLLGKSTIIDDVVITDEPVAEPEQANVN